MAQKSDSYKCFVEWKAMVELETGLKLKIYRTDNGGEYVNALFKALFLEEGIQHQLTVPYSPQQNGKSERMNRTILERVISMLSGSNMTNGFWDEAAATAVHLINCSPSTGLKDKTPYEAWHGSKPVVSHFRIFGAHAYALIPKEIRPHKLSVKTRQCRMLGYCANTKGYRLWWPEKRKIIVS